MEWILVAWLNGANHNVKEFSKEEDCYKFIIEHRDMSPYMVCITSGEIKWSDDDKSEDEVIRKLRALRSK